MIGFYGFEFVCCLTVPQINPSSEFTLKRGDPIVRPSSTTLQATSPGSSMTSSVIENIITSSTTNVSAAEDILHPTSDTTSVNGVEENRTVIDRAEKSTEVNGITTGAAGQNNDPTVTTVEAIANSTDQAENGSETAVVNVTDEMGITTESLQDSTEQLDSTTVKNETETDDTVTSTFEPDDNVSTSQHEHVTSFTDGAAEIVAESVNVTEVPASHSTTATFNMPSLATLMSLETTPTTTETPHSENGL